MLKQAFFKLVGRSPGEGVPVWANCLPQVALYFEPSLGLVGRDQPEAGCWASLKDRYVGVRKAYVQSKGPWRALGRQVNAKFEPEHATISPPLMWGDVEMK